MYPTTAKENYILLLPTYSVHLNLQKRKNKSIHSKFFLGFVFLKTFFFLVMYKGKNPPTLPLPLLMNFSPLLPKKYSDLCTLNKMLCTVDIITKIQIW